MAGLEIRSFDAADDTRTPPSAKIDTVTVGGRTLARGVFQPGWRWSESVKPIVGTDSCGHTHVGAVVSGRLRVRLDDGTEKEFGPGDAYHVPPGHDGWVVGDEPFVSIEVAPEAAAGFAKG